MIDIYNPYNIDYGSTIEQSFIFSDFRQKVFEIPVNGSALDSPLFVRDYLNRNGLKEESFSLSLPSEMDNLPLKDNCFIPLSPYESMNMTDYEVDMYYDNEYKRCLDDFKYAQNKTFQFITFTNEAYLKFKSFFGDFNFYIKFDNKYLNLETFSFFDENATINDKKNVFLYICYAVSIDEFNKTIRYTYCVDISSFIYDIDVYSMKLDNFYNLMNNTIKNNFNLYPKNININPETSEPYNIYTKFDNFYFEGFSAISKIYTNQIDSDTSIFYLEEVGVDEDGHIIRNWVYSHNSVLKLDNVYEIKTNSNKYYFYSDDGLTLFIIEFLDLDLNVEEVVSTFHDRPNVQTGYKYSIDNVYFKIKFLQLPESNDIDLDDKFNFLEDYKKKVSKCCLFDIFNKTKKI